MAKTIFYSWQSDLPNQTNRGFIRRCIDRAVRNLNRDLETEDAARVEEGIKGAPGNVDVARTIFERVDACGIFVPDISIITPPGADRPAPNPNVLIEYGRATGSCGDSRIVPVFNTAFGEWLHHRPFDMKHKGPPVTYHLAQDATQEERNQQRAELVKVLEGAFREIIEAGLLDNATDALAPTPPDFEDARQFYYSLRPKSTSTPRFIGFWCAAKPASDIQPIPRPFEHPQLFTRVPTLHALLPNTINPLHLCPLDNFATGGRSAEPKPTRGGGIRRWRREILDRPRRKLIGEDVCSIKFEQNGSVFLGMKTSYLVPEAGLSVHWILTEFAAVLRIADHIRELTNQPSTSFWAMFELRYDDHAAVVAPVADGNALWRLGLFDDDSSVAEPHFTGFLNSAPHPLGPYLIEPSYDLSSTLSEVLNDILAEDERDPIDDLEFSIPDV